MKKIRVLSIVPSLKLGSGVASYAMNYFKYINRDEIHMDFMSVFNIDSPYIEEIRTAGSKVYLLPKLKKVLQHFSEVNRIMEDGNYDIVHCNLTNLAPFYLYIAKKNGINTRIVHSHFTVSGETTIKRIRNDFLTHIGEKTSTDLWACSQLAGSEIFRNSNFSILKNAIIPEKYEYNSSIRENYRRDMGLENNFIILTIGRFKEQKNPFFIIDLMSDLIKVYPEFVLLWVGNGTLEKQIISKIDERGLTKNIRLLGSREDVSELLSASDIFILPSNYEGLPVVGVEAQANGIPVLFSDKITKEVKINSNVSFLPIDKGTGVWIDSIISSKDRIYTSETLRESGYSIDIAARELEKKYLRLVIKE